MVKIIFLGLKIPKKLKNVCIIKIDDYIECTDYIENLTEDHVLGLPRQKYWAALDIQLLRCKVPGLW